MKIGEALAVVDRLRPNQYDRAQKISWLSALDGMIWREVILTHTGKPVGELEEYGTEDTDKELLVPFPYAEDVYNAYLQSRIDRENGEMEKYSVSAALFNSAYKAYTDWYNRTHRPIGRGKFIF